MLADLSFPRLTPMLADLSVPRLTPMLADLSVPRLTPMLAVPPLSVPRMRPMLADLMGVCAWTWPPCFGREGSAGCNCGERSEATCDREGAKLGGRMPPEAASKIAPQARSFLRSG
jgi:hypothetical protein